MNYSELTFWQKSRTLATEVFKIAQTFPEIEQNGLGNQMRATAIEIPTAIATGISRNYKEKTIPKLSEAIDHSHQLESQILLASDLEYINEEKLDELLEEMTAIRKMTGGFIRYMNKPKAEKTEKAES